MENINLRQKCVIKYAHQIIILLQNDISYNAIINQIKKRGDQTPTVNFLNSKYAHAKKYRFLYSQESALSIINSCQYYTNSYELILNKYFEDDLNIHSSIQSLKHEDVELECEEMDLSNLENSKFAKSNLSQKAYFESLEISDWDYSDLIVSAVYFYIEKLYDTYLQRKKFPKDQNKFYTNNSFYELRAFSSTVALLLLNKIYGKKLFITLENTNLFVSYPDCWLYGFSGILHTLGSNTLTSFEKQDRLEFFQHISTRFPVNFYYISFYLKAFASFIPLSVINPVSKYCFLTKEIHILYYILKKYQNQLYLNLPELKKEYIDYCFNTHLKNELEEKLPKFLFLKNFGNFLNNNNVWLPFLVPIITLSSTNNNFMAFISPKSEKSLLNSLNISPQSSPSPPPKKPLSGTKQAEQQRKQQKQLATKKEVEKAKTAYDTTWSISYVARKNLKFESVAPLGSASCLIAHEIRSRKYTQLGRSGSYKDLVDDKKRAARHMKGKYPKYEELCKIDGDHIVPKSLHNLTGYNRNLARCIQTSVVLNGAKEYAKKGQKLPCRVDGFKGIILPGIAALMLKASIDGMWERVANTNPEHLLLLDKFGALEALEKSYATNLIYDVKEMSVFANQYNLTYNEQGIIATYTINHMLNISSDLAEKLKILTDYREAGKKFRIEYLIPHMFKYLNNLADAFNSIPCELKLPSNHSFSK